MKEITKKILICSAILCLGALSANAKIDGSISKQHFYDLEKTIMPEILPVTEMKMEKYWDTNLFHINKYRPIFMLSNKELYCARTDRKVNVINRLSVPSVYNVSFKASSVKKISLAPAKAPAPVAKKEIQTPKAVESVDLQSITLYESAKNQGVDSDQKIETALLLKETKNVSNYLLAIDLLDDVTRIEPYNAYAYYIKGELYSAQSDTQAAMKNYVEALKLNPYSKQSCLGIAKILEPKNRKLAQKYYDRAK